MGIGTTHRASFAFLALLPLGLAASCASSGAASAPHGRTGTERLEPIPAASPRLGLTRGASWSPRDAGVDDREPFGRMRLPSRHYAPLDDEGRAPFEGLFLYGTMTVSGIEGDMDGTRAIVDDVNNPTQFLFLPDIEPSAGAGFMLGMRFEEWELLLGWSQTDYDAEVSGVPMDTKMTYVDFLFRYYFMHRMRLQPYMVGGFGLSSANIDNGSLDLTDPMNPVFSKGKLNDGITYSLGGGVSFYLTNWLAFFGQGIIRLGEHESVTGPFGETLTEGNIDTDGWEISTGVSLRIHRGRRGK